ncbi:hypothetical protein LJC49_10600 [Ruminococcaceae bacterium OttesenSCG-928-I18]|nr:hypothetical protein [Ruminococcaceae bacterium OttesenSCG-928-I18]
MKKICVLLCLMLVVIFSGCGSSKTEKESNAESDPQASSKPESEATEETTDGGLEEATNETFSDNLGGAWAYTGPDQNTFAQIIINAPSSFIYASGAHAGGGDTVTGTYSVAENTISLTYTKLVEDTAEESTTICEIDLQGDQLTLSFVSGDALDDLLAVPGDSIIFESGTVAS